MASAESRFDQRRNCHWHSRNRREQVACSPLECCFLAADSASARTLKQRVEPSILDEWLNCQTDGRALGKGAVALAW